MLNIEKYKDEILNEYQQLTNQQLTNKKPPNHSDGTRMNKAIKTIAFKHCEKRLLGASGPFKWLCEEHKEPVLDEVEKAYLSAVIKPFKANVTGICKINICRGFCCIMIYAESILSEVSEDVIDLPLFETGTMYKGMETDKHYSLEELGL